MCRLVILAVLVSFASGCKDSAAVNAYYNKCMALGPGVTVADLRAHFGKEYSHRPNVVTFIPHPDYVLLTSNKIIAHLDPGTGSIVRLECGEFRDSF